VNSKYSVAGIGMEWDVENIYSYIISLLWLLILAVPVNYREGIVASGYFKRSGPEPLAG
jgi:hypothetical protein